MEEQSLIENQPRVKFTTTYKGTLQQFLQKYTAGTKKLESLCIKLRDHLWELEYNGVTPVQYDGKVAGNGGALFKVAGKEFLLLSKSGKESGVLMDTYKDFVIVESFDRSSWSCEYYSCSPDVKPTSDAPLYHTALLQVRTLSWDCFPTYMLHGHAFETEPEAKAMGIPISSKPTLFSTPEDSEALFELMKDFPYPKNQVFIRMNHGFVLLGHDAEDAWVSFEKYLKPHIKGGTYSRFLFFSVLKFLPLLLHTVYNG